MNENELKAWKEEIKKKDNYTLSDLIDLMTYLHSPEGCPWDRVQTHESLRKNLIEEAYEAVDAIDSRDDNRIVDEMGDVLMQVIFHAELGRKRGAFSMDDIIDAIVTKLISRHTHLFGDDSAGDAASALTTWEANKREEKGFLSVAESLADVPKGLPALLRAYKIQKKAAAVGFDWPDAEGAAAKVAEEMAELKEAKADQTEQEAGDLLFAAVNYVRLLGLEPEVALSRANEKFVRRFTKLEEKVNQAGQDVRELGLSALDEVWDEVKREEKTDAP